MCAWLGEKDVPLPFGMTQVPMDDEQAQVLEATGARPKSAGGHSLLVTPEGGPPPAAAGGRPSTAPLGGVWCKTEEESPSPRVRVVAAAGPEPQAGMAAEPLAGVSAEPLAGLPLSDLHVQRSPEEIAQAQHIADALNIHDPYAACGVVGGPKLSPRLNVKKHAAGNEEEETAEGVKRAKQAESSPTGTAPKDASPKQDTAGGCSSDSAISVKEEMDSEKRELATDSKLAAPELAVAQALPVAPELAVTASNGADNAAEPQAELPTADMAVDQQEAKPAMAAQYEDPEFPMNWEMLSQKIPHLLWEFCGQLIWDWTSCQEAAKNTVTAQEQL
jgi:hypothetical protein